MKRTDIEALLPEIFRRTLPASGEGDNPLLALLDVMDVMHAPDEAVLSSLDAYFDPYRAPEIFVPYLAGWVDLDSLWIENPQEFTAKTLPPFPAGVGHLRDLVASAVYLSKWRGTEQGLLRFLELATGISGYVIDERVLDDDGLPIPFHVRVHAPAAAEQARLRPLIERIIEKEKPAYVTCELVFEGE